MTKKKTNRVDEGFLDSLIGDAGAAGLRSMFKGGMTKEAQLVQDLFIKDFVADAVASLNAGIQGGFIDPNIRGGTTAATNNTDNAKPTSTGTGAASTPGSPAPTNIGGKFTQPGTPAQSQQSAKVPPQNVKFNMNTPGAKTSPTVAPKTYPVPANTRDVKAANRVPDDISETAYYKKLNALFESIFEATGGQSIATYMTSWFKKYMGGVNWDPYKNKVEPIIQSIEDTYSKDKGVNALRQLAQAAFAIVKVVGEEPEGAKDIKEPAGTQGSTGQQPPLASSQAVEQITKSLPNMQLSELEALKKAIDSAIASKNQPSGFNTQTQYMGKVAPNARAATKPASPFAAPTVPNKGTISSRGTAPKGDITKGGIGMTRESRRPRR